MNKCPNCGGIFPVKKFVCDYCGYVESEKIKQLSETDTQKISFDESLGVIQDNLNALNEINKPTIKNGVFGVLRVIAAIHTFGIVLIFWKKSKKRFNKKSYKSLKSIIERNIEFLKISSEGSDDLLNRIKVIEQELIISDHEVKRNLRAKRLTSLLIVALYMSLFFIENAAHPMLDHPVYAIDKYVNGELRDTLKIALESYELKYYGGDNLQHFRLNVIVEPTNKFELKQNEELSVSLQLTDTAGIPSDYFYESELESVDLNLLKRELKKGPRNRVSIEFTLNEKKALSEIPREITNFIINTEIRKTNQ